MISLTYYWSMIEFSTDIRVSSRESYLNHHRSRAWTFINRTRTNSSCIHKQHKTVLALAEAGHKAVFALAAVVYKTVLAHSLTGSWTSRSRTCSWRPACWPLPGPTPAATRSRAPLPRWREQRLVDRFSQWQTFSDHFFGRFIRTVSLI